MAGIRMDGDFRRLKKAISNLEGFDYLKLNKQVGQEMRTRTLDRFKDQKSPDGKSWPVSIRVREEGGQTLSKDGGLSTSIKDEARTQGVAIGTNLVYARIHQKGGTIKAKRAKALKFKIGGRWVAKKEVTIPKREYLGFNQEDIKEISSIMEDQIKEHVEP